ncbi:MAG: TetR family transcriptional regulator [Dehalococcoidia bacterium]|nr:TetR family transcriptional regulator [Dehalococcoidia bacterium]
MTNVSLLKTNQREETRRRLMEAAVTVFSRGGYERSTVDVVARTAGYSKGAFYVHFDSKEALLLQVLSEAAHDAAPVDSRDLQSVTEALVALVRERPYWAPLASEFAAHAWRNDEVRAGMAAMWERFVAILHNALTLEFPESTAPFEQAELLVTLFRGAAMQPGASDLDVRRALDAGCRLIGADNGRLRRAA